MNTSSKKRRLSEILVSLPSFVWLTVFFLLPTIIILAIAFRTKAAGGGIGDAWTLQNLIALKNPNYPQLIWRTIWMSISCTILTLIIAVPIAYHMARVTPWKRDLMMLLTIVPFWTNFMIRIFAWKSVLHRNGMLKALLVWLHLAEENTQLLYNPGTVLLVMIYTELPFAILPLYAAAEKFDFSLFDAAMDLGATRLYTFFHVFIPGIASGLLSACLMVLIPAVGSYVIPDLVGGKDSLMLGNEIYRLVFPLRNPPGACALTAVITLVMLLPLLFFLKGKKNPDGSAAPAKEVV
jgi:spermidine/putrescine transport system permease protein